MSKYSKIVTALLFGCSLSQPGCLPMGSGGGGDISSPTNASAADSLTMSMQFDNPGAQVRAGKPPEPTPGARVRLVDSGGGSAVSPDAYRRQGAANAIMSSLTWADVESQYQTSPVPSKSATSTATIRPLGDATVVMSPGGSGGIGVQVDNTNPVDNPVTHILLWIEGGDGYVRIPVAAREQTGEGDVFQAAFTVPSDVCANVCNQAIEVDCYKAALTQNGDVTDANRAVITLRCESSGSADRCEPPGGGGDGSVATMTVGPGSSGVVTMYVDNPDESSDPVVSTVIWMDGADSYIELPADGASMSGGIPKTLGNGFVITNDICNDLCNIAHQVKCYESAVTASGVVTAATLTDITVECSAAGSPSKCASGGRTPPSGGATPPVGNVDDPCGALTTVVQIGSSSCATGQFSASEGGSFPIAQFPVPPNGWRDGFVLEAGQVAFDPSTCKLTSVDPCGNVNVTDFLALTCMAYYSEFEEQTCRGSCEVSCTLSRGN